MTSTARSVSIWLQREAPPGDQTSPADLHRDVARKTVSEPGSQSGDVNSLSRDWDEILSGRRSPLRRRQRRRRVASAEAPAARGRSHGGDRDGVDMLALTMDANQRRVILGAVPKYRQDDDGGGELQVLPFPGMLIQAFSAVDLDPAAEGRSRSPRPAKKVVVSRAKHAGSLAGAKLPKVSSLKRPLAAKHRMTPGETARVSSRDRKLLIGAKPKLKYCTANAGERNAVVVLNGIHRAGRKSEKHKPEVGDLKTDTLKGRTPKHRQKRQQASSKREQGKTSNSTSKSVKRTSFLTAARAGVSPLVAELKKNNETYAHAQSLPSINEVTTIKSALKKPDRPAAPPKSVQFGAEYIREVTKIEYISDEYDDDVSTTGTELSDFSVDSINSGSDVSEDSDDSDDSEWRL